MVIITRAFYLCDTAAAMHGIYALATIELIMALIYLSKFSTKNNVLCDLSQGTDTIAGFA